MICKQCNNPIVMHIEGRYTIEDSEDMEYGMHYRCHEARLAKLKADGDRLAGKVPEVKDAIARLRKVL